MANMSKFSPDNGLSIFDIKDGTSRQAITNIEALIPSGASTSNKLATMSDIPAVSGFFTHGEQRVMGAYNLCPNNIVSQRISGVTVTVNDDLSVTVSGEPTAYINIPLSNEFAIPNGTYLLCGTGRQGGTLNTYFLTVFDTGTGQQYNATTGNGVIFTITQGMASAYIHIEKNIVFASPHTFKPMITTDLTATYDDYVPYSMTNRELTDGIGNITNTQWASIEALLA